MNRLTALWMVPLVGAVLVALAGLAGRRAPRMVAAFFAVVHLALVAHVARHFLTGDVTGMSAPGPTWAFGISYQLSCDALSLSLVALTAFLTFVCVVASWNMAVGAGYWVAFLALSSALCGVFLVRDLFLFYVFWEATLIPMFFIIGIWGSANRRHAAVKFFLFTFGGSILMLLAIIALVGAHAHATGEWTWDLARLVAVEGPDTAAGAVGLSAEAAPWVFVGLLLGFAVKIPIVPLHTWLPDAHTEAPAAGSVMLAGVMLKMGVYGIMRIAIPLFPQLAWAWLPWLGGLAAANVIWGALCAMAQSDLKRLIAYSSIAHLGFCMLGVLSRTDRGLAGGALQLLNHGITTGALFLLVGFLYDRAHVRGRSQFGDLAARAPMLTFFFAFATLSSIGLPGLNGFVGEFLALTGIAQVMPPLAWIGCLGVTLAAAYALPAFQDVFWGAAGPDSKSALVTDLSGRERAILWVLSALMLAVGLSPGRLLEVLAPALEGLVR